MLRLLLLLPLGLLAGCYYPYGSYSYGGYYDYNRPYPPPQPQNYAPQYQPYTPSYPQQGYQSNDQPEYQIYGQPPAAAPSPSQPQQGYGQPADLAPPPPYQGQSAYQPSYAPPPTPYQSQPQDYGPPPSNYGGPSSANCGTPDEPRACD